MRLALAFVIAAGCIAPAEPPPPPPPDYDYGGGGWSGPGGAPIYGCQQDTECGAQVCARDGQCYPATSIRAVHVTWTVGGEPASDASCAGHPYLSIHFATSIGDSFGYAPVPCKNGKFTVDKLATSYARVELMIDGAQSGTTEPITSTGDAAIDLP